MDGKGKSVDPWRDEDRARRESTFADIDLASCATRLQVLGAVGTTPMDVSGVAAAVGVSVTLASAHLSRMARAGLVDFDRCGGRHVYRLAKGVTVEAGASGVHFSARADDGCRSEFFVPSTAALMRLLHPVLAAARSRAGVTVLAAPQPPSPYPALRVHRPGKRT